jgi:dTDP-4-dehydrorhamnose 3,5-epimerase
MKFTELPIPGAFLIEIEPIVDERGFFARTFCKQEFLNRGLNPNLEQCSLSFNAKKGTLRGMHYQIAPFAETKLVHCIQGAIYDVILDLRPASHGKWHSLELTPGKILYVPEGVAHGFQTLVDDTKILYHISAPFAKECARGVRFNSFGITWPLPISSISMKDLAL